MFPEDIRYYGPDKAQVDFITTTAPAEFPTTTDGIAGMRQGVALAPGSTVYVTSGPALYMLGTNGDWREQ